MIIKREKFKNKASILGLFTLILVFSSMLFLSSCGDREKSLNVPEDTGDTKEKIKVVASIFPLYEFSREVGGDQAEVTLLLPAGLSPHSFEPTPKDIQTIEGADIFVFNGAGMEPWLENILSGIDNSDLIVVDASIGITPLVVSDKHGGHDVHDEHEGEKHENHEHPGGIDPHFWLDFTNAKIQVDNVLKAYREADPGNSALYEERAKAYSGKLAELDVLYKDAFTDCGAKDIASSGHFAFGYMARRYGLGYHSVFGVSHDAEPSPKELSEMVQIIKDKGIKYIFAEELLDPRMAKTIKEETGAEILIVNPAGNVQLKALESGISFIDIMKDNLEKFKMGIECK
ncbi:MAG: zinc ABC transporter substrate-binding protein [Deltaproteobacteria bacterium]|uniref:Zinc ABC transporter substrate-binding protein n=1 Tax=Candidatus Zymogenus saltonus TaxID=2844893 RepID=A0A9D8KHU0_9DELT|nr:zinc ABC transporter substrate-binding protein [Candidatus Zymogenus saltonus]